MALRNAQSSLGMGELCHTHFSVEKAQAEPDSSKIHTMPLLYRLPSEEITKGSLAYFQSESE